MYCQVSELVATGFLGGGEGSAYQRGGRGECAVRGGGVSELVATGFGGGEGSAYQRGGRGECTVRCLS